MADYTGGFSPITNAIGGLLEMKSNDFERERQRKMWEMDYRQQQLNNNMAERDMAMKESQFKIENDLRVAAKVHQEYERLQDFYKQTVATLGNSPQVEDQKKIREAWDKFSAFSNSIGNTNMNPNYTADIIDKIARQDKNYSTHADQASLLSSQDSGAPDWVKNNPEYMNAKAGVPIQKGSSVPPTSGGTQQTPVSRGENAPDWVRNNPEYMNAKAGVPVRRNEPVPSNVPLEAPPQWVRETPEYMNAPIGMPIYQGSPDPSAQVPSSWKQHTPRPAQMGNEAAAVPPRTPVERPGVVPPETEASRFRTVFDRAMTGKTRTGEADIDPLDMSDSTEIPAEYGAPETMPFVNVAKHAESKDHDTGRDLVEDVKAEQKTTESPSYDPYAFIPGAYGSMAGGKGKTNVQALRYADERLAQIEAELEEVTKNIKHPPGVFNFRPRQEDYDRYSGLIDDLVKAVDEANKMPGSMVPGKYWKMLVDPNAYFELGTGGGKIKGGVDKAKP